jgi:hypothetical protein
LLTFEEFQGTREWCQSIGNAIGDEDMNNVYGFLYHIGNRRLFIQEIKKEVVEYWTVMYNEDILTSNLETAERWLWDHIQDDLRLMEGGETNKEG